MLPGPLQAYIIEHTGEALATICLADVGLGHLRVFRPFFIIYYYAGDAYQLVAMEEAKAARIGIGDPAQPLLIAEGELVCQIAAEHACLQFQRLEAHCLVQARFSRGKGAYIV